MTDNRAKQKPNNILKFSIYPDDVTELPRAPSNPKLKEIPYIQPMVSEIRQSIEKTTTVMSKNVNQTFEKFNSYWLQGIKVYLYSEKFQLGAIGISSLLGTFLLVRKRKPLWRYSLPILVSLNLTGYTYLRKEWNDFDLYSNIIALQKRTPLPPGKLQDASSNRIQSHSEDINSNSVNT